MVEAASHSRDARRSSHTDGVIERRDQVIDEGIDRLEPAFRSADPGLSADELANMLIREVAVVTAADDDIALLVLRLPGAVRHRPARTPRFR